MHLSGKDIHGILTTGEGEGKGPVVLLSVMCLSGCSEVHVSSGLWSGFVKRDLPFYPLQECSQGHPSPLPAAIGTGWRQLAPRLINHGLIDKVDYIWTNPWTHLSQIINNISSDCVWKVNWILENKRQIFWLIMRDLAQLGSIGSVEHSFLFLSAADYVYVLLLLTTFHLGTVAGRCGKETF